MRTTTTGEIRGVYTCPHCEEELDLVEVRRRYRESRLAAVAERIVAVVTAEPGIHQARLLDRTSHARRDVLPVLEQLQAEGRIHIVCNGGHSTAGHRHYPGRVEDG
jgi:hypothetical protein